MHLHALVCPLNWGLGHATRCIPVIEKLLDHGYKVTLASDGGALSLLRKQFPQLDSFELPAYDIQYPSKGNMIWKIALQLPKLWRAIQAERLAIHKWITQNPCDLIVSDNRFGCYHPSRTSVYITHQLSIMPPLSLAWLRPLGHFLHRPILRKFDQIWIPDQPEQGLSGWLGHSWSNPKCHFIGIQSRFAQAKPSEFKSCDRLYLLSGPEPQRTQLENLILEYAANHKDQNAVLVRGLPHIQEPLNPPGLKSFNHLNSDELSKLILEAKTIICRSGYSTLMDLCRLNAKAILIPTPGQTEQEYLALYAESQGWAPCQNQAQLNLDLLDDMSKWSGFGQLDQGQSLLDQVIGNLRGQQQ